MKIFGLIVSIAVILVVLMASGSFKSFNFRSSLGAVTVSDSFLNELLRDPDTAHLVQRARDAGLVVESFVGDTGSSNLIRDPATGQVVLSERTEQVKLFSPETAEAKLVPTDYGVPAACEFKPGANVYFDENGEFDGIRNLNNQVHVTRPAGIDDATYNKVLAALNNAFSSINHELDNFAGDTSRVPRFSAPSTSQVGNVDVTFVNVPNGGFAAQTSYRRMGGGSSAEYTEMQVNVASTNEVLTDDAALNTAMIHEVLHAMGLDHTSNGTNVLNPQLKRGQSSTITPEQIEALIKAHDPSSSMDLTKCAQAHDRLVDEQLADSCPADVMFVRDPYMYYHYGPNYDGANGYWYPGFPKFEQGDYNSLVTMFKTVVTNLANSKMKFAVIEPRTLYEENDTAAGYGTVGRVLDAHVSLPFSSDFTLVRNTLDTFPVKVPLGTVDTLGYDIVSYMPRFEKNRDIIASLASSGRDSAPNLIIYRMLNSMDILVPYQIDGSFTPEAIQNMFEGKARYANRNVNTNGGQYVLPGAIGYGMSGEFGTATQEVTDVFDSLGTPNTDRYWHITFDSKDADTLTNAVRSLANELSLPYAKAINVNSASINSNSSNEVTADGATSYTITVSASEQSDMDTIDRMGTVINREGPNAGVFRGYIVWDKDEAPFTGGKDQKTCSGGGFAAINPASGASYLTLVSCSVSGTTGGKTANFTVRFDPSYKTPEINNTISGFASNCAGGSGWKSGFSKGTFSLATDKISPTVSITSPANNYNVVGSVAVSANASDNVGVEGVQFKLDGNNLGVEDTISPYSVTWMTTASTTGNHTFTAVARDKAGNTGTSNTVSVTVNKDILPPTVSITNVGGATVSSSTISVMGTSYAATANASDNVGVASVEFKLSRANGTVIATVMGTSRLGTYTASFTQQQTGLGQFVMVVTATDTAGNKKVASPFNFTVVDATPQVNVTGPLNNASFVGLNTGVVVSALSSDDYNISKVEIYIDNILRNTCPATTTVKTLSCSFTWSLVGVPAGKHTIYAKAYESNTSGGKVGTSPIVNVTR